MLTPKVLSLTPSSVEAVWTDIQTVGDSCGRSEEARQLTSSLKRRIAQLKPNLRNTPRVLCLEWLEPPLSRCYSGHALPSSHFSRPGPRILDGILEMTELFDRLGREQAGRQWPESDGVQTQLRFGA
jgi:hypothetical protein